MSSADIARISAMARIDLERGSQWATVGSFFVGLVGLWLIRHPAAESGIKTLDWLPAGLIAIAILGGGAMHWMALRAGRRAPTPIAPIPAATAPWDDPSSAPPLQMPPRIEVTTSGYPLRVDPLKTTTLIAWRNKYVPDEGGRVDLINGSIHVELWNAAGKNRTGKVRGLRFSA